MPWDITYLPDIDTVLTVYSGVIPPNLLVEAVQSTIAMAHQAGTRKYLADCSTLEGGHSIFDLYDLAKLIESAGVVMNSHEALVLPQLKAAASEVRFWETACRNRGLDVRIFETVDDAREWLAGIVVRKHT